MNIRLSMSLLGLLVVSSYGSVAGAAGLNPGPVSIQSLTHRGTGCPPGSISANISPDAQSFTLLFDAFITEAGPALPANDSVRDCLVELELQAPRAWSWAVVSTAYRGFIVLPAGLLATWTSNLESNRDGAGIEDATAVARRFVGPLAQDYVISTKTLPKQISWSKCDGTGRLRIHTILAVHPSDSPADSSLMTLDSMDGQLQSVLGLGLLWRRCD